MYTTTDIGSSLAFHKSGGAIQAAVSHDFTAETPTFDVVVTPNSGSPVASALAYREHLLADGGLVSLDQKITNNPRVRDLVGAPHAYVWGSGRTPEALDALASAGVDRFWVGYDGDPVTDSFVTAQKKYLIGPYDSWANAQDPATSDSPSASWPDNLYPQGCVRGLDGGIVTGFGGRGCYLSSTALAQAQRADGVIADRVKAFTPNGADSYFLDVDAVGQLFDDSTPSHPQTKAEDRALRLERMEALARGDYSNGKPLVLGSEAAEGWANPAIAFSHGSSTPVFDDLWKLERDKATWGGYWPTDHPGFFFKPVDLPQQLATAMFAPQYRVPLYETVLHDSVVSTDRWELGLDKLPSLKTHRILMAMLYNEPVMYSLDMDTIAADKAEIATQQRFFAFIQASAGTKPLTSFRALSSDRLVQQTVYGNGALTVTVNFGQTAFQNVPPGCATAADAHGKSNTLCP
ncbi:glycoside hydrolase [Leifsonia sp. NPDC102414]|uniref:glycoside hydrolase n=1 Tax=Leifsonia sp. NPDC102414 TaxID=3364124 RepID=UPI0037FBCEB8